MSSDIEKISAIVSQAAQTARKETSDLPEPEIETKLTWPIECKIGPGLEGAIACETEVGYVNGSKGWLVYRGYDIFDLCMHATFEEVAYLLLNGSLPSDSELRSFKKKLMAYLHIPATQRLLMSYPLEEMNPMAALRFGVGLLRQKQTFRDKEKKYSSLPQPISSDDDSYAMETDHNGKSTATYEFQNRSFAKLDNIKTDLLGSEDLESCYHLISGVAAIAATIARIKNGHLPLEPDPSLGHAANLIYMMTGRKPTAVEERVMDIALILHADHGMNASTFASLVVASTLSDIYFAVDSGIAALSGPLHGGANEQALLMLKEIGGPENVKKWYQNALKNKQKIMGVGHRVYKAYDPRARVLGPLAEYMIDADHPMSNLLATAKSLEKEILKTLGADKNLFPNVDYYSGIVYSSLGISPEFFTPIFAVSRVVGWTARILEYLKNNRIFRPRALYTGSFNKQVDSGIMWGG